MGYVYVMDATKIGAVKIGVSECSVDIRQRSIQTGCPAKIERVWCSKNIPDYRECEKELHKYFHEYRMQGEWFAVPFSKASIKANEITTRSATPLERKIAQLEATVFALEQRIGDLERRV